MLTLEKFEEASEVVKKVAIETKLLYSPYFSEKTGNKVYLKPCLLYTSSPLMLPNTAERRFWAFGDW